MNIEEFRNYCLSKAHVSESFPFDQHTLVFKVGDKLFALTGLQQHPSAANLKCDPERAIELRDQYPEIVEGYHMSKKHWNTITIESGLSNNFIKELIDHSYDLVVKGMTKKQRLELFGE